MSKNKKEDQLLESNYDGIQEYDNDLPRWWLKLFYATILFAPVYAGYIHLYRDKTSVELAQEEVAELKKLQNTQSTAAPENLDQKLSALVKDHAVIDAGKGIYQTRCAACHGANGEGLIGPNLTDNAWIHGGKLSQIHSIIVVGVLEKGMLAWKGVLKNEEIDAVVAYIATIQGTTPANPKAPQGDARTEF